MNEAVSSVPDLTTFFTRISSQSQSSTASHCSREELHEGDSEIASADEDVDEYNVTLQPEDPDPVLTGNAGLVSVG